MKQIRRLSFFVLFLFSGMLSFSQSVINFNSGGNTIGCAPNPINYTISGNITAFTNYTLNFGDGSPIVNYTSSTLPSSVSHTYTSISCGSSFTNGGTTCPNAFGATLTGTNSTTGQQGSWVVYPIGISQPPISSFTIASTPVCANTPITFTNTSFEGNVYTPTGSPCAATCDPTNNLYWQLTGPSAGNIQSGNLGSNNSFPGDWEIWTSGSDVLVMSFATPGLYTMKLFVGNPCSLSGSVSTQTFCVVAPPQPQFSVNPATGCYPPALNVAATNSTTVIANACFPTTYAYNWSVSPAATWSFNAPNTATSQNSGFTFSAVGNYSVTLSATVNGLTGCTASISHPVTVTQAPTASAGLPQSVCAGGTTLQLTGTPSGGTWSGTGVTTSGLYTSPATLLAGSVTLTYTLPAISPCPATSATVLITINPKPTVTVVPLTPAICNGNSVSLTASSSIALSTFAWSPTTGLTPSTGATVVANPTSTTAYTVTGTAPTTGCSNTAIATVTVNPKPTVSVPTPAAICVGASTSLTATGAGGLGPYTYVWSPALGLNTTSGATVTANPTITSTYTVTVTDSRGCTGTSNVTVTVNTLPTVNAGNDLSICTGSGGNTLTGYTPTGGTWSGTGVTSLGVYTPGGVGSVTLTYSVTQNGCTATDQIVVTVIAPTAANAGSDQGICLNATAINLTGTPASGSWTGSTLVTSAGVFSPSTVGTYTLTYTIGSGSCLATDQKIVTVYALPTVTVNDPVICAGAQATLTAVGAGGLSPFSYAWSPSAGLSSTTGASVTTSPGLSTSYTVTVTDAHTCTTTDVSAITVNPIPTVNAGSDVSICNGSTNNTLTGYTPTSGTWSGTGVTSAGVFTPSALGNVTLTYSVTQTGCTGTDQIIVTVINPTNANAGNDQGICLNAPAITLTGTPSGGTWSGDPLVTGTGVFTPSAVGSHTLTYSYGTGSCATTDTKIITVYALPTVIVNDPAVCAGSQATLSAVGASGLSPYTYAWTPSTGLSAATGTSVTTSPSSSTSYTVTVSDGNSCTASDIASITVNPIPTVNAGNDVSICNGSTNNALTGFSPTGGTWSGTGVTSAGVFTPTALGNITLTYSVTQNSCTGTDQIIVTVINPTNANAGADQGICLNASAINLTGTPSGGIWSGDPLVTGAGVFAPSSVGTHTLTYSYGTGSCATTDTKVLTVHALPTVSVNDPTICAGTQTTLTAVGSDGLSPYTYSWTPASGLSSTTGASVTTSPASGTNITVTISDANSCTASDESAIIVNPIPTVNAGNDVGVCNTPNTYTLTGFSPSGGTWSGTGVDPAGVYTPNGVATITLTYSVTQNGCTGTDDVVLNVTDPVPANAGTDEEICLNATAINLTGTPSAGTWSGDPSVSSTGLFTPSVTGNFTLTYTFGTGNCMVTDQKNVTVHSLPIVTVIEPTICVGDIATLSAVGSSGLAPYTYDWSPITGLSSSTGDIVTLSPTLSTSINVTISDANSCDGNATVNVNVNQLPIVEAGADLIVCFTTIPTVLSGATPVGGTWSGIGVNNGEFVPATAGSETIYYTYTEASTGCINLDSILITANNPAIVNAGNDTSVCVTYDPFLITGQTPLGGSWTVDLQVSSTGTFTATQVGSVTLTYTYGSGNCAVSDDRIFTVQALPVVEAGLDTNICVNSPVFNFSGESPITAGSWTWSGIGISDGTLGTFSALQSTAGVFTSVYTYTETATGCSNADSLYVTVNSLTPVNVTSEIIDVCLTPFNTMLNASPLGGVWTGSDINFLYNTDAVQDTAGFVPTVNGVFQAFYTYTDLNNCVNADTSTINVVSPIDAVAGPDVSYCYSTTDIFQLTGSPIVGSWTDPLNPTWLLEDGTLTPIEPDTTNLIITIGSGSCQTWDTTQVVIFPLPFIDAGVDTFRCFQDPCFQLSTPIPTGGIWSGNGITDTNGLFCSTIAGEGVQILYYNIDTTYYYQSLQSTCLNEDSIEVLVVPMPVPGLSIDPVLCVNVDYLLGNESSGPAAEFEWTILSLPLNDVVFFSTDPAPTINLTVPGSYQLILNSISPYGCSVTTSSDFIVVTPPIPEFAISDDLGCAPYQGLIANTSSGYDLTYSWDFGPLFSLDSDVNPIMPVFPSPVIADSLYYVQLSLTNLCGTRTYLDSVIVRPQPFALITTDYSIGCSPMNIVIQNISYGSPESFSWNFGNGTTSTDSLPAPLVFSAQNFPQVFNIIVEVTNSCGVSIDTSAVVIYPSSFSIGNIVPQTACAPYEFSFQSPLSGQTLYLWDFGDGEGAVGENVSHLYNDAGSFTLQLSVSNFCFTDTVYSTLNLLEGPTLDFDLSANSICEDSQVSFTNSSTLGSSYQWLIDGTALSSYSLTQNQSFTTGGLYQIGLAGTNPSSGCRDTIYSSFDVVSRPVINVIASPDTGCSPLTAQFINTTTNATSYQWTFSDGTGSSALSPTVVIPANGNFSAELIAHNYQTGLVDCPDTTQINVLVYPTPQSMFSLAADAGCGPPASVQTNNQSSSNLLYTWTWENQNSTENSPLITFADTGYKAIELKVTNEFQCSDSSVLGYRVYGQPRIDFNLLPAEGCAPLNVDFQNLTQYGDSISWGFGDGNFSNLSLANHTYSEAGFYPVEVHVSSGNGLCFDDTLASQAIHVFPVAYSAFQVNPLTISQTSPSITLYNSSSGYTGLEFYIDSNLIGNDLPGTYLFENPDSGFVQLVLIANNEFNCPDTTFTDVYVQSAPSIYYPNAFSPNGDGVNDGFKLFFDRAPTYYNVRIYDRWGHIVFKSRDYEEAWDGTYLNRGEEPIKSDVYVLKFSAFFEGSIRIDDLYKNVVLVR